MNLSNQDIDKAINDIRDFFKNANVQHKDVIKICLVVEEALLRWQDRFGEAHEFKIYTKKWFTAPKIIICLADEPFNPLKSNLEYDEYAFSNDIMKKLLHYDEAKTIYRYENGYNELISYSTRERKPLKIPGGSITIAIILAIAFSFVIGHLSPEVQSILSEKVISPALSTLTALIVTVTVFMIFFSIVAGICAIEDVTMLSNIGSTVVGRFFLIDVLIVAVTFFISSFFFPVMSLVDKNVVDVSEIMNLLLSIIPTNILESFLKG